ncbi:Por secretion system C-terminal sorting domain-containing protein [Chitinophaga jiangningensis]|uniref:Por secretion system C-terminal sorting domain-containing protein n=1 Tax=Chitinophaga jiangningensis TaxID=1419482 RepID=A0A1M7HAQ9_9BACT|nr:type IX secretion system sortase PorU [Chitinophaga jiangningensis]SHM25672.1 Por secretion system C-terminal sorting domain-containing protein [Chitinophaga jiangningensis]
MKVLKYYILALTISIIAVNQLAAQSFTYHDHSVLATGKWIKLAVSRQGIYKIDAAFLRKAGLNQDQLPAGQIRIFGNGGALLPENHSVHPEALQEVALMVNDGGDNIVNGNDYILFYAPGPHSWSYNKISGTYSHQYNIYSDTAWYYLNVGELPGARVAVEVSRDTPEKHQYLFDYHTFYEKDSLNFLRSGKQWFAEEFSLDPAAGSRHTYRFSLPAQPKGLVNVNMRVAARGATGSNFKVSFNKQEAATAYLLPVSGNVFEAFATAATGTGGVYLTDSNIQADVDFLQGDNNARGWLDYLEIQARCQAVMPAGGFLSFRTDALTDGRATSISLYNANGQTQVWDVTRPRQPLVLKADLVADSITVTVKTDTLRELVAFQPEGIQSPVYAGTVANQDLLAVAARMLIVTVPALQPAAQRLANWHQQQGLETKVITMDQVYNEFSAGTPDPTALRNFLKMQYDKGRAPEYLLLFGAASYDYRNRIKNNTNLVPSWQSTASLDPVASYVSDDYYGLLRDSDDINRTDIRNELQVAIGRIPARNATEAAMAVDKIIAYRDKAVRGDWRNRLVFIADDEDNNLHLEDAEALTSIVSSQYPQFNVSKIYLDAYQRLSGSTGATYPDAVDQLIKRINQGALIVNYSGHGSNTRLAEENIIDGNNAATWKNEDRLPLLLTATCDFAPFDNPAVFSLGQSILLQRRTGAIALMTTTRAVFAASNKEMNINYINAALSRNADGSWKSLGQASKAAKNLTYATSIDIINNRKFQLLGDPALTLAFPQYKIVTDSINNQQLDNNIAGVPANSLLYVTGHIEDESGVVVSDYNGQLYTTIFAPPVNANTLGNTAGSQATAFAQQENVISRGAQTITAGKFRITAMVPVDAAQAKGIGKISYYASGNQPDAGGLTEKIRITELVTPATDQTPPALQAWLNNRLFKNGDLVGPDPLLLVDIADTSGINISGLIKAHKLLALLDSSEYIVLNDYFSASLDNYRKGTVAYPLAGIAPGKHRITITAWDNQNNSANSTITFEVTEAGSLVVDDIANYPNPFHSETRFVFTHNQQGMSMELTLQIFNLEGKLMKTLFNTIIPGSNRFDGMPWDGTGDSGAKLSPGIYLYRLTISSNGKRKVKGGKVMLF